MHLSNAERLILIMLSEIHESLKIKSGIEPQFVKEAIYSGNEWGLAWKYSGVFGKDKEETPPVVKEVCDILDMWSCVEHSLNRLTEQEKLTILAEADATSFDIKFVGFDGNNESAYMNVAHFLIKDLERFQTFEDRADLNSHCPVLDTYQRMTEAFLRIRPTLSTGIMGPGQIIEVLKARIHPENRKKTA